MRLRRYLRTLLLNAAAFAASAAGPAPAPADPAWDQTVAKAHGTEVRFAMWGGSDNINRWVDKWVAPRLKQQYGVTLKRQATNDPVETINKLVSEKQAGRKAGSIDLVWINGENFKMAKAAGTLAGPFTARLPAFRQYYDQTSPDITHDFGTAVEGFEAPYGKAQFVFVYDSAKVKTPPQTFAALLAWVKQNPGRFTYPAPPDFTGSAFVRQVVYATTGGPAQYLPKVDLELLARKIPAAWAYLNEMRPYLWLKGVTYPESKARLEQLFADGDVWMSMGYSPTTAEADIRKGTLPKTTRTFVMQEGTLANTHFVAVPFNAPHPDAALVLANLLLTPDAQLAKFDPTAWGDLPALDTTKLTPAERSRFEAMDLGVSTLPLGVLAKHRVPEIPPEYVVAIERDWLKQVAAKAPPK